MLLSAEGHAPGLKRVPAGDREVEVLMSIANPRLLLIGDLLTEQERVILLGLSMGKLRPSLVVGAEGHETHATRTSEGTHFDRGSHPVVSRVENRVATLIGCPLTHIEPLQVLHYREGGEYRPHFDWFDAALPGAERATEIGGQRIATLIMYLASADDGGATIFPSLGLELNIRPGQGVYFENKNSKGEMDRLTLHGGSPVRSGEKWIATAWVRERPYVRPAA